MQAKEVKQVALFGAGGAALGGLFHLVNTMWQRRVGGTLSIPTEAIQHCDRKLLLLFLRLESQKDYAAVEFLQAVDAADRLVYLRMQLENEKIEPGFNDRANGRIQFKRCESSLHKMLGIFKEQIPVRDVVINENIIRQIVECLESHVTSIYMMTKNHH